ncbi:MAG: hypothetical protein AAFV88_20380 [Planctomycetota bacterium]
MSEPKSSDARKTPTVALVLVGLLLIAVAAAGYPLILSWSRYQEQFRDIIAIRKGRGRPTVFEFRTTEKNHLKIPEWSPFGEQLAPRVKRINVRLRPEDSLPIQKLSKFKHLDELEITVASKAARLELPAGLTDLTATTELTLVGDKIGDLAGLSELTNLKELTLIAAAMPEVPDLTDLPSLERVELVADVLNPDDWAHNLPSLERLDLLCNRLENIGAITRLQSLDQLVVTGVGKDFAPLTQMSTLKRLTLHDATVTSTVANQISGIQRLILVNSELVGPESLSSTIKLIESPSNLGWRDFYIDRWPHTESFLNQGR